MEFPEALNDRAGEAATTPLSIFWLARDLRISSDKHTVLRQLVAADCGSRRRRQPRGFLEDPAQIHYNSAGKL